MVRGSEKAGSIAMIALVSAVVAGSAAMAYEIPVRFGGREQTITSIPHRPWLIINSRTELLQKLSEIRSVIPRTPFRMDGRWLIPCGNEIRSMPDIPERVFVFSRNGEYVLTFVRVPGPSGGKAIDMELATTTGRSLWRHHEGPFNPAIGNTGVVAGQMDQVDRPTCVMVFGREGNEVARLHDFVKRDEPGQSLGIHVLDEVHRLVFMTSTQLMAFGLDGSECWRRAHTYPGPLRYSEIGLDPLGRGLYTISIADDNARDIEIIDPVGGDTRQWLWKAERGIRNPREFSATGKVAVLRAGDRIGLLDWQTGLTLFSHARPPLSGRPGWGTLAASGTPPLLVQWSDAEGSEIYNAEDSRIWRCKTSLDFVHHVISDDGKMLGIVAIDDSLPLTVLGMLVYKIRR